MKRRDRKTIEKASVKEVAKAESEKAEKKPESKKGVALSFAEEEEY